MPIYDYLCDKCGHKDEYIIYSGIADAIEPKQCPKCSDGQMERLFSPSKAPADIIGGYDYVWGKKAWKRNLSVSDQAAVVTPDVNGNYKSPY